MTIKAKQSRKHCDFFLKAPSTDFSPQASSRPPGQAFARATNSYAPKSGYYAPVSVSASSPEDARVPVKHRDYSTGHAILVTRRHGL